MNITLLVPNIMNSRTFLQPPLELYTAAALLRKRGIEAKVFDFRALDLASDEAIAALDGRSDLFIVSTSPYDMAQMYHMDHRLRYAQYFVRKLKEAFPCTPLYITGAHGTLNPEEMLVKTGADGVIMWELEACACLLVKAYQEGASLESVPNLVLNRKGVTFRTEFCDSIAHPAGEYISVIADWDQADFSKYFGYSFDGSELKRLDRWGVIMGSRGCPFACNFCFNYFKNKMRFRNPSGVAEEFMLLCSKKLNNIFFLDMVFTVNRDWTLEVCRELITRGNTTSWICQTRCDLIDDELLQSMYKAGCRAIQFGVESFQNDVLTKLNKQIDETTILKALKSCQQHRIIPSAFVMVGTPFESDTSVWATIDMLKREGIPFIPIIFTPRFGSPLGDESASRVNASSWKELLALRGRLSEEYGMKALIADHSLMKGQSFRTVPVDFKNTRLEMQMEHHRLQFKDAMECKPEQSLLDYLVVPEEKRKRKAVPYLSFPLTSTCPFQCNYCGPAGENTISPVSLFDINMLIDIAVQAKRAGIKKVRITGGEPLTHPDFADILRFLSEDGFYVLVNTNGLLIENNLSSLMRTSSNIHFAVSLDTLNPERFDMITNTNGNFDQVMRGIKILKDFGYLMRLNMVVGKFNIDEVLDMVAFCETLGCDLKLQEIASVPYPNAEWDEIHCDISMLEKELATKASHIYVHNYASYFGIPVKIFQIGTVMVTLKAMHYGSRYDIHGLCRDCPHLPCHEGLYDVYVLADGSIAICRWHRFGSFATFSQSLEQAVKSFQAADSIGSHKLLQKMHRVGDRNRGDNGFL